MDYQAVHHGYNYQQESNLCPAAKTVQDGMEREEILFLRYREGYRLPVKVRVSPLKDRRGRVTGAVEIFSDATDQLKTEQAVEELREMALLDPLTGIGNRRFGEVNLRSRLEEKQRYGWDFGVLFVDLDDFKNINDRFRHRVGDEILRMTASTLDRNLRTFDVVSRWGGEEFLAIVANVNRETLFRVREKLRFLVANSGLNQGDVQVRVTISAGGTMAQTVDSPAELVSRADHLMLQAKRAGKNRVVA